MAVALLAGARAQAQWTWRNPLPQGNDLWCVTFAPGSQQGWAVGGAGTILATANGGSQWAMQESGTDEFLRGVSAASSSQCWAAGDMGTVLITYDGGASWSPQPIATQEGLNQVYAASTAEAWTCGDLGLIFHTTDGGATWTQQPTGVAAGINDIAFPTAQLGVAVGSGKTVLRTTNGGGNWTPVSIPGMQFPDLLGVFFLDASTGWIAGTGGALFRTTNGGAQWTRVFITGVSDDLNRVAFRDASNGIVVGENGAMAVTTNGGAAWTALPRLVTTGLEGVALTSSSIAAAGVFGEILHSTGGAYARVLTGSRPTVSAMAAAPNGMAWAVGDLGAILATSDGGATWTPQTSGTSASLYGAAWIDGATACVCGAGGTLLRTANGGATWTPRATGVGVALNALAFPTPACGFAVGGSGRIIKTTDGGLTWTPVPSGTLVSLHGIDMADEWTGVAAGDNGLIIRTSDGGASWQQQPSFTLDALFGVALQGDNGWICGDAGTVLVSTDGGQTWDSSATGNTGPLYAIAQTSPYTLAAVGENGVVLRSDDGGWTWTRDRSHAMYAIYAAAVNGGVLYAGGDLGMLLTNAGYPMPAEFLAVDGRWEDGAARIRWTVAHESRCLGYEVQRLEGASWRPAGFVASDGGTGERRYAFTDRQAPPGTGALAYRIRLLDADGSESFSPRIDIARGAAQATPALGVHPNPVASASTITVELPAAAGPAALLVADMLGRTVMDLTDALGAGGTDGPARSCVIPIQASRFPASGAYIALLRTAGGTVSRGITIIRP